IGLLEKASSPQKVIYELRDHVGNVRVAFSWDDVNDEPEIESWADYYPFGEMMPGRNGIGSHGHQVTFQGMERAEGQNWYDFPLRMYNASLGRFISPDPYGQFFSPYLALANDPISHIDPDGGYTYATTWFQQIYLMAQEFNNTYGY